MNNSNEYNNTTPFNVYTAFHFVNGSAKNPVKHIYCDRSDIDTKDIELDIGFEADGDFKTIYDRRSLERRICFRCESDDLITGIKCDEYGLLANRIRADSDTIKALKLKEKKMEAEIARLKRQLEEATAPKSTVTSDASLMSKDTFYLPSRSSSNKKRKFE